MDIILCFVLCAITTIVNGNCPQESPSSTIIDWSPSPLPSPSPSPSVFFAESFSSLHSYSVNDPPVCVVPHSCKEWFELGINQSGVFPINPSPSTGLPFQVYCDMEGGIGWTLIQRRQDGSVDFNRNLMQYKEGFGDLAGEFWLGLTKIYRLTLNATKMLRIELRDDTGNTSYAEYNAFAIGSSYELILLGDYTGTAGNSLRRHSNTPVKFRTPDDSDIGAHYKSGWWFESCIDSNLNGLYEKEEWKVEANDNSIVWNGITEERSIKGTVMKIY